MWTKKQRSSLRNSTKSGVKTKKKVFISRNERIFTNFGVKPQKKVFVTKFACQKTVLAHEFWGDNQQLGSLSLELHSSGTEPIQLSLGHNPRLGGTSSDLGEHGSEMLPWRRACCKFTAIYRTVTIAFLLKRYCSKSVLLKKSELFEIIKRCHKPFSTIFFICENTIQFV